jgi:hypothetical protein
LGARQANVGGIFSDFRIKQITVKCTSGGATAAVGFLDDSSGAEGDAPTNIFDVLELRCSASLLAYGAVPPTEFFYTPVDTKRWYKTNPGASGSDPRNVIPAVLYASTAGSPSSAVTIELDITIVYKGATDVGSA